MYFSYLPSKGELNKCAVYFIISLEYIFKMFFSAIKCYLPTASPKRGSMVLDCLIYDVGLLS